jgi:acetyl-CoA carboxylase biotin carboxyl carrier protein
MNNKEIRDLLQLIEQCSIEEFELERSGLRLRVRKAPARPAEAHLGGPTVISVPVRPAADAVATVKPVEDESLHVFKAPIVGTFYITPKPDAEPFVRVGDRVRKGTVLCVIEAMKLFNQIECDVDGNVVRVLVENGQAVEYGEPLFEIRLSP